MNLLLLRLPSYFTICVTILTDRSGLYASSAWINTGASEPLPNHNGGAMAMAAGLMVDGVKLHAFMAELSRMLAEELDEKETTRESFLPGGENHVPVKEAKVTLRRSRWEAWLPKFGYVKRALSRKDHSWLMGWGVAHALNPKLNGHGSDPRKKLGLEPNEFLEALLSDEGTRARLKKAIADVERPASHVGDCVTLKRSANATYDMIDAYRHLFLIKHPSRRAMLSETRRVVAMLYARMGAGPAWASGQEVEAARLQAATKAHADAERAQEQEQESNAQAYIRFCTEKKDAALAEAKRRGMSPRLWMKITGEWHRASKAREPAHAPAEQGHAGTGERTMPAGANSDGDHMECDPPAVLPMPVPAAATAAAATAEEATATAAAAHESPHARVPGEDLAAGKPPEISDKEAWNLGGYMGVDIVNAKSPRGGARADARERIAFVVEFLKTPAHDTKDNGRFGLAAFKKLQLECEARGVTEVHLIVRLFETAADALARTPKMWAKTMRAYELYMSLGFTKRTDSTRLFEEDSAVQVYMAVTTSELSAKLKDAGSDAVTLRGGATFHVQPQCRFAAKDRAWFEMDAIDAIEQEHDAAKGGDGASVKQLLPKGTNANKFSIFELVPVGKPEPPATPEAAQQLAEDIAAAEDAGEAFEYAFKPTVDAEGNVGRVYLDANKEREDRQQMTDDVEQQTAIMEGDKATESWGAMLAHEVLQYLLLERLRGCVVLPPDITVDGKRSVSKAAYFGYKMTFDAAVVRRAKRGHKKWTTIILQVLCCGVEHGKWGRNAIVGMLEKAQSANKFAKVRVWNGGDDRANFEAHVVPLIDQLLELQEKGMMVDELMMPLPPCIITLGEDENVAVPASMKKIVDIPEHEMVPEHKTVIGMHWRGGAQSWEESLAHEAEEAIIMAVATYPKMVLCLDGGAWSAAAGERCCAERPSLFTSWTKEEFARPFEWVWLDKGDSVLKYCERERPGDVAFRALAIWVQSWREHGAGQLSSLTRPVDRVPLSALDDDEDDVTAARDVPPMIESPFEINERQRRAEADRNAEMARVATKGARGEAVTTWADARLRRISPKLGQEAWLKDYGSEVDGQIGPNHLRYGIVSPLEKPTLVRMPVKPDPSGSRSLPKAAWGDRRIMDYACLCILHGAMRTGENLYTRILAVKQQIDLHEQTPRPESFLFSP